MNVLFISFFFFFLHIQCHVLTLTPVFKILVSKKKADLCTLAPAVTAIAV